MAILPAIVAMVWLACRARSERVRQFCLKLNSIASLVRMGQQA